MNIITACGVGIGLATIALAIYWTYKFKKLNDDQ